MKNVIGERCNVHTMYHFAKGFIPIIIIIDNNRILYHDATKKNNTEQTFTKPKTPRLQEL